MRLSKKLLFIHIPFLSSQTYWAIILAFMQVLMFCNVYRSCRLCSWSYLYCQGCMVFMKFLIVLQVVQRFQELFAQTKYKEVAELAAESPQGLLRTPETVAKFQVSFWFFCVRWSYWGLCTSFQQVSPLDIFTSHS